MNPATNNPLPPICEGGGALSELDTVKLFIEIFIGGLFKGRSPLSLGIGR